MEVGELSTSPYDYFQLVKFGDVAHYVSDTNDTPPKRKQGLPKFDCVEILRHTIFYAKELKILPKMTI